MNATLTTCNGHKSIAHVVDSGDLPRLCREAEIERNDGYAVIAWRNGRIVADADGYTERDGGGRITDAATLTGMYDH